MTDTRQAEPRNLMDRQALTPRERDVANFAAMAASDEVVGRMADEFVQVHQVEGEWLVLCIGMTIGRHATEEKANAHAETERMVVRGKLRKFVYELKLAEA